MLSLLSQQGEYGDVSAAETLRSPLGRIRREPVEQHVEWLALIAAGCLDRQSKRHQRELVPFVGRLGLSTNTTTRSRLSRR